jgi:hypothetical protein
MTVYALRVWVPDRPGALGQVASRIGAVRGDVVGIEILERGAGQVIDELLVELPDDTLVDLLVAEVSQVDGVAVEDVHALVSRRPDGGTLALQATIRLATTPPDRLVAALCDELMALTEADWVVAVQLASGEVLAQLGSGADPGWAAAFLAGSQHLGDPADAAGAPADLAWAHLPGLGIAVAVERRRWGFRAVERQHLADLGRLTDALATIATAPRP